ncbi:MAG: MoaD/ThiS family protein [Candidatus Njordarchaeum guaymaensis]
MYLKIKLLSYLREISGGKSNIVLKFEEDTIKLRAVLSELQRIFGNTVKKLLINESKGELKSNIIILINKRSATDLDYLITEDAEITIMPAIGGG